MSELTKREKIALEFAKAVASKMELVQLYPGFKRDSDGGVTISCDLYFETIKFLTDEFISRIGSD